MRRGIEILDLDVPKLIGLLRRALSEEWFAYYQYWAGAKVAKGPMKDAVTSELLLHATEELGHAELVAGRLIQLGGDFVTDPADWPKLANCKYEAPDDPNVSVILDQNIRGEQCAISTYKEIMDFTKDKDPVTYNIAVTILTQEIEHEEDLSALKEDLEILYANLKG